MKIKPIAFDSLGTRSMCTVVETCEAKIVIDPGAALGPRRYGLKPHRIELERLRAHKALIREESEDADILIITHYHYDHFPRPEENVSWIRGKQVYLKDPSSMINRSQRGRSSIFLEQLRRIDVVPERADGRELKMNSCRIVFSQPVQHGNDARLGYVLEVLVDEDGEKLIHTSDVEGLVSWEQVEFIARYRPQTLIVDGPMTYMLGTKFFEEDLETSLRNLCKVMDMGLETLVLDHHLLRELEWRNRVSKLFQKAEEVGVAVMSAAEYAGLREEPLEAMRRKLYEMYP